MTPTLALLLALCAPLQAAGPDLEGRDQVSDPDMLGEVKSAADANLDSALSRGAPEAARSAQNSWLLLAFAHRELNSIPKEIPPKPQAEDLLDSVSVSAQMLQLKAAAFRQKASLASLRLKDVAPTELNGVRASYRSNDRSRDLAKAESYLSGITKPATLTASQAAMLAALSDCLAELKGARLLVTQVQKSYAALDGGGRPIVDAARRLSGRAAQIEKDIDDLRNEARLLEVSLRLARQEEASFDQTQRR